MGMFETMVGYNPDSPIKGLPEFISKEKQAAIALEQEKYKLEIHKAELENKKNELAQKNTDYFWKALDTASKYKGSTRKNILKAIPSIIKQQTGKDVNPDVANAFMTMAGEGEPGTLGALDMNRATTDIDYRNSVVIPAIQGMLGSDNPIDALDYYNKFTQTEQKQMQLDATAANQLNLEKAKQSSAKEILDIKEQSDYRKEKRASFDKIRAQARTLGVFKDDPEWYAKYVEAKPDEQLRMESALESEVSKRALVADKAARAALDKKIGMALKYASPAEASIIRKLQEPNTTEEVKALANETLNNVLGTAGPEELKKLQNEAAKGSLGNAKAAIDLGGGEGLAPEETKGLVGGRVTPAEQKAIETAQQRKMQNAAKKANKASNGMTPNQIETNISKLATESQKIHDKYREMLESSNKMIELEKLPGGITDRVIIGTLETISQGKANVIREHDEKSYAKTAGFVGSIEQLIAQAERGDKLTPEQRSSSVKLIKLIRNGLMKQYASEFTGIESRANRLGINRKDIISDAIDSYINESKRVKSTELIKSGKKVLKRTEMVEYLRSKGKSEAQINSTIEKMKADGARFE